MTLVVCIPGKSFSNIFLENILSFQHNCLAKGINVVFSIGYSPNLYIVRNMVLGGSGTAGNNQKPWQGKVNYDYAVGINSDSSLIRKQGSASLVPNGKQQDYEVFYQHNLDKNSQLRLNLMMQKELNNFKSAPTNYVGYLSFGSNF